MNNDFFLTQAKAIAKEATAKGDTDARIKHLYDKILNRPAGYLDLKRARQFLEAFDNDAKPEDALGHFAHLLLVSTEFLFLD